MSAQSFVLRLVGGMGLALLVIWMAVESWGGPSAFFAHPARAGAAVSLLIIGAARGLVRGGSSAGVREDVRNRWVLIPMSLAMLVILWLPPYGEPRDLWLVGGDAARYAGLLLFAAGAALRISAIGVLRHRFCGVVAIQAQHALETGGPYRFIRHPGYLGLMLWLVGWCLVFRSGAGVMVTAALMLPLIARMNSEEALLASEFSGAYDRYRRGTWRLVPYVY